jgi:hypothetical protein
MRIAMFRRNIAYLFTKNKFLEVPNSLQWGVIIMFGSKWTFYLVRCLILILAAVGIFTFYNSAVFYFNAERATGLITQIKIETKGKGKRMKNFYYPVIEFVSQTGEQKIFKSKFGTATKKIYKVGDQINVLFNGEIAVVNSFINIWAPTIYSIIAAILLLFCYKKTFM